MIVHLDADAFFASVEQAADPKLRGKPIAVGGDKRGIIASASYEARKLGIYTPMPTARARKLCPRLIVVPGDFEKYERFSRFMFSYAYDFTPEVEVASIDEGYFDLGGQRQHSAHDVAEIIRRAIRQSLKITVSEGIASNKLVSQVASKLRKPACFIEVESGFEKEFLAPLPNKWLPGVGPKVSADLSAAGLAIIDQIAHVPADALSLIVGSYAPQLRAYANGIDDRAVVREVHEAKSYGRQDTFSEDTTDEVFILAKLRSIADHLAARVREDGKSFRTITLKVRYNDMDETMRSISLNEPSDIEQDIYPLLPGLLKKAWERRVSIRLVSLRLTGIYGGIFRTELALDVQSVKRINERRLAAVIDGLRTQCPIMRGHDLWLKKRDGRPRADLELQSKPTRLRKVSSIPVTEFVPLNVKSFYSFLDSTLSIPAIIEIAKERGAKALALTDTNLHGAVEFSMLAREAGIKPVFGAEVSVAGRSQLLYVENQTGYENLCRLLSEAVISPEFFATHREGLFNGDIETLALPEIRYHSPGDRTKYNILQSIRTLTRLNERHAEKREGAFHWPLTAEVAEKWPSASIARTHELVARCTFDFELHRLRFPRYAPTNGSSPKQFLEQLAWDGLRKRYGDRAAQFESQLREELGMIAMVGYEEYFLTTWDLLQECHRRGIQWITRGSAADSLVCYCLGISGVCPIRFELYFRRFLNVERMSLNKLPDIDIDFAHDRKDDVVDIIFERYGMEHAAIVGGFNTFQARSAVADIAKVLGVSEFQIRRLTANVPRTGAAHVDKAVNATRECQDSPWNEEPFKTALSMASFLDGFPRHAKMHPCGVVLSRDPIHSLTPTFVSAKGYPTTHFEMEAVEQVGLVKMDILAQGGLAVIRDALAMLAERGVRPDLENLEPWEDPEIWRMIATGNARCVHHIESPAMISLAKMCNVRDIDCLIAIVSVIRPGAANGMKKLEFARRAQGLEPPDYVHPSLAGVLRSTFGVVAYEEHILQICEEFAGLSPGRADVLRRALVKQKQTVIEEIGREFIQHARARGHSDEDIGRVWELVYGFQGYAFCRAHSTAYGVEAYQGAYLKRYHPAEFLAAVLSNGKGFYTALAYTLEARRIGIQFAGPDVNASGDSYHVEGERTIRVPLRAVKGLTQKTLRQWQEERRRGAFSSLHDFYIRVGPEVTEVTSLIQVGAFDSFGESRTSQCWELRRLSQWPAGQGSLFRADDQKVTIEIPLTEPTTLQRLKGQCELLGFTVSGHPLELYPDVAWDTYCRVSDLHRYAGQTVVTCGLVIADRSHHQITGDQMKFITLCDYSGMVECEIFSESFRRFGLVTIQYPVVEVEAEVTPFESGLGYTLNVKAVRRPRGWRAQAS